MDYGLLYIDDCEDIILLPNFVAQYKEIKAYTKLEKRLWLMF